MRVIDSLHEAASFISREAPQTPTPLRPTPTMRSGYAETPINTPMGWRPESGPTRHGIDTLLRRQRAPL